MTHPTDIDIRNSADQVIASLSRGNTREAMQILERERNGEDLVVQEALDRYIGKELPTLRPRISAEDAATFSQPLQRLQTAATSMPRFPSEQELRVVPSVPGQDPDYFSPTQRYDMYASIVETRGNLAARTDLAGGTQRVILGMRQENATFDSMAIDNPRTPSIDESQSGKGVYDDRLVVLWKDADDTRRVYETTHGANTEPTAQYDHHAGSNGRRPYGDPASGSDTRRFDPSPGYENIAVVRKIEGEDVNNDGMRDLGRLAEGTVQVTRTTHPNPATGVAEFSLRPSAVAVRNGQGQVQRDTNGDGWFTQQDVNGVQDLNNTFKIHRGSSNSTDSAGCQTVHPTDHTAFMAAVKGPLIAGNPVQQSWQYVLTATSPGMFRGVNIERGNEQPADPANAAQDPRHPAQQGRGPQPPPQQGVPGNGPPAREDHDPRHQGHPRQQEQHNARPNAAPPLGQPRAELYPRDRNHPDFALYQQALAGVHQHDTKLGRTPDEKSEQMAASLTVLAKENGINRIDHVAFSIDNGRGVKAGENVFIVQGEMGNPAADRAHIKTDVAVNTSVQTSFQQLESIGMRQAQEVTTQHQQQTQQAQIQQQAGGMAMRS